MRAAFIGTLLGILVGSYITNAQFRSDINELVKAKLELAAL